MVCRPTTDSCEGCALHNPGTDYEGTGNHWTCPPLWFRSWTLIEDGRKITPYALSLIIRRFCYFFKMLKWPPSLSAFPTLEVRKGRKHAFTGSTHIPLKNLCRTMLELQKDLLGWMCVYTRGQARRPTRCVWDAEGLPPTQRKWCMRFV